MQVPAAVRVGERLRGLQRARGLLPDNAAAAQSALQRCQLRAQSAGGASATRSLCPQNRFTFSIGS